MAQFDDAKVGTRLWSEGKGWGKIIEDDGTRLTFKIKFELLKVNWDTAWFTKEGVEEGDINPTLFWDEVKIVPPERPKEVSKCSSCNDVVINPDAYDGLCSMCYYPKTEKPKEECEACKHLKRITPNESPKFEFDWERDVFLLNKHHTCEKGAE